MRTLHFGLRVADLAANGVDAEAPGSPDGSADSSPPGSAIPTATGSSWSNGRPATPTA
ncbi:MAG TPA: hypothetical protein VFV67_10525 [Actinophytocola sp.]|uniref:hypothetical protein n=1 Tax=Actinophytocola sp. TaxID=1872138 RepID=UPI002DBC16B6|nr:hypothetical protein [Actinophytocola sp.]HEU5471078.1 hypothetical protein [Actinophytocola sp.]